MNSFVRRFVSFVVLAFVGVSLVVGGRHALGYAGPTLPAVVILVGTMVAAFVLGFGCAWAVRVLVSGRSLRARRGIAIAASTLVCAAVWILFAVFAPRLDHRWTYLLEDVRRSYGTYLLLTFLTSLLAGGTPAFVAGLLASCLPAGFVPDTLGPSRLRRALAVACVALFPLVTGFAVGAFLPPLSNPPDTFVRLATRDSGFAKGTPSRVIRADGHTMAVYRDEDYGEVLTLDGRPIIPGNRFRAARILAAYIPLFEMPTARSAFVIGREARVYAGYFKNAGLNEVKTNVRGRMPRGGRADLVLVAPEPDWIAGARRMDLADWRAARAALTRGGVCAYHLDARLLSVARAKALLAEFGAVFPSYRLWCVGLNDWVAVGADSGKPVNVLADEALELFERRNAFDDLVAASSPSVADLFSCYVGAEADVTPALAQVPAFDSLRAAWTAPRLAFAPPPDGALAALRPGNLLPLRPANTAWFIRGTADPAVYVALTNRIAIVQSSRRTVLLGFDEADRGKADDALAFWTRAAQANPRDPLLRALADSLDLEGRRRLRVGDANGALRCYENRILVSPDDAAAIHNFGVCLKKSGQVEIAARAFSKAVLIDPDMDEHRLELAETAAAAGHPEVAVVQLDFLRKKHPVDPSLALREAKLLCNAKNTRRNPARAIALAEEAVRLTKWRDRAYVIGLADVYLQSDRVLMGMGLKKRIREMTFDRDSSDPTFVPSSASSSKGVSK